MNNKKTIRRLCQVTFSPLDNHSSRILKECNSLLELNICDNIVVLGTWRKGLSFVQEISEQVSLKRQRTISQRLWSAGYFSRRGILRKMLAAFGLLHQYVLFFAAIVRSRPDYIACHHVELLPVSVLAKWICRSFLVYAPHELETQRNGLNQFGRMVSYLIERALLWTANSTVVVCEPIADWYRMTYKIANVYCVPNAPSRSANLMPGVKNTLLADYFSIPKNDIVFIYQGLLDKGRGIEDLLKVFVDVPVNRHLVIMGYGPLTSFVDQIAERHENIHFKSAVPVNEVLQWTSSADVGVFFTSEKLALSYKFSMPNKFYEYSMGNLYLIVSDNFAEQSRHVERHHLGSIVKPTTDDLRSAVLTLTKETIQKSVESTQEYRRTLSWEASERIYFDVYKFSSAARITQPGDH